MCQGLWKDEWVAIKVLTEDIRRSPVTDLRQEARIWASVNHENCVSILAICTTEEMKIITPLLPLGCLRDYVLNVRENIGSRVLLNWCTQIARVGDSSWRCC